MICDKAGCWEQEKQAERGVRRWGIVPDLSSSILPYVAFMNSFVEQATT